MVKLKNSEAMKVMSPAIDELFADKTRRFPVTDAFMLTKAAEVVRQNMKAYQDNFKKIVEDHGGAPAKDNPNMLVYKDPAEAAKAEAALVELNSIVVEFNFKPVKAKEDWPQLSLGEMLCLEPLLDTTGIGG